MAMMRALVSGNKFPYVSANSLILRNRYCRRLICGDVISVEYSAPMLPHLLLSLLLLLLLLLSHYFTYKGDSPERDLCDILVSFFNVIYFKVLKIPEKTF